MTLRNLSLGLLLAGPLSLALAGCTTTGLSAGAPRNAVEARWNGQSAGVFFAAFGPPIGDAGEGASTEYTWRGGYKTMRVPAKYAVDAKGKKGKRTAPAQTRYLSCTVKLKVDEAYMIRSVSVVSDRAGLNGPSYCAEFLAGTASAG